MSAARKAEQFDVIVVGSGVAGLSAGMTALQAGLKVAILERAPREDRGGNTRWTEAFLRIKAIDAVADDFESHFARNAGHHLDPELVAETAGDFENRSGLVKALGFSDPDLISAFAQRVPAAVGWLQTFGVRFDWVPIYFITQCTPRMGIVGGGLSIVEQLSTYGEKNGARILYKTSARRLIQDDDGAVVGVMAVGEKNRPIELRAPSVVLACGGFEGNPEMLARYMGPASRYLRPVARGGYYNKGEGIRMALDIGAAPSGDYTQFHAEPLDPRSGAPEPVVQIFNYGILVNTRGERFVDEAPATVDATYEAITRIIGQQPDGLAYLILDAGLEDIPNWKRAVRSDQPPITAASLAELAGKINVDPRALATTVAAYNAACPSGGKFDPLKTDGLATKDGYVPVKSNWSRPIKRGPFMAFPIMCGNCFTFGGLKVNPKAEVLNADGEVIPGLYAAGETVGIYYGTYTGATSVLRGAVFGRLAGEGAIARRKLVAG